MDIKKIFLTGLFFAMALVGYAQEPEPSGDGYTYNENLNEYTIHSAAGLRELNNIWSDVPEGASLVFEQGVEYNLEGNWISNIELSGDVIGNGATIKFRSKDSEDGGYATGLFRDINCEQVISIENLTIEANIKLSEPRSPQEIPSAGLLVSALYISEGDDIRIKSVNVEGKVEANAQYGSLVGGLIGYLSGADYSYLSIQDCESNVEITNTFQAGGFVGGIDGGTVRIKNSISKGSITSLSVAGGLVGGYYYGEPLSTDAEYTLNISSCANTGDLLVITGEGIEEAYLGGLVGNYDCGVKDRSNDLVGLIIDYCCNTGSLNYEISEEVNPPYIGSLVGRGYENMYDPKVTNSFVCYSQNDILNQHTYPFVFGSDNETFQTLYDNRTGAFVPENAVFVVESKEDFDKMLLAVMAYNAKGIKPKVEIKGDFNFKDISYEKIEREGEIEDNIGRDLMGSIGSSVVPFEGDLNADGAKFYNYAVVQNSLMGNVGKEGIVKGISMPNAIVVDKLSNSVKDSDGNIYAAVLANKNSGVISYCSYVGVVSVPNGVDANKVVPCLVGENSGEVSYSFMYITNLNEVKAITSGISEDNKAAIIVKGNTGVGKKAGGKQKKVAVNNVSNKSWALLPDAYFTPDDAELNKEERGFSNEEFASGVVAYWLNYAEAGYTGEYTCRYSQGEYTPELQSEAQAASDGGAAVHKIVYDVPEGTSISSGAKPFVNGGEEVVITLSKPVKSATVTVGESNKSAATATISADGKTITFTVPKTKKPVVMLSASNNATALTRVEPNSEAKIVVIDGKVKVFGAQGETVVVYGINGAVLHSEVLTSDKVDLPAVPHGIYFVKVGGATKKISL